ncbi:TetR/AcrR family transcriptional regulator [Candidatus Babeliales bacterium]|nr:TetR/AcrR family transcriptional regulator [Candidatus Babeliales bacterium]MBP9844045.1 TetR/AcrR family transcriptional regulator [Candidatus Babeliales bacterium]
MSRITKKPESRRAQIIEAARHLFQTQEYEKTSMQDVIIRLNIAKGTIYHYFPSKEALLQAVIEDIVDKSIEEMKNFIEQTSGNALKKMLLLMSIGNLATLNDNENILNHLHRHSNDIMHLRLLTATLAKQAPLYAQIIEQGCKEGIFKTKAPLESAEFILYAVQFLTDKGIAPYTQEEIDRRAKAFPKLIEQILQAPAGSFEFIVKPIQQSGNCDCDETQNKGT